MKAFQLVAGFGLTLGAFVAALNQDWLIFWGIVIVFVFLIGSWFINKYIWIRIPAMNAGLVFNAETKAFSRFLLPGRHRIWPYEQVKHTSIAPSVVKGKCGQAQTNGGVNVSVRWSMSFVVKPTIIADELRPNVAKMLLSKIDPLIQTNVNNCITHLLDQKTVTTICDQGARSALERELRDLVVARLSRFGVQPFRVILNSIELPHEIIAAVEAAHKQELLAQSEARALTWLHQAVSQFSDIDMERLLQLRQLQELRQHGVALHIPMYPMVNNIGKNGRNEQETDQQKDQDERFYQLPLSGQYQNLWEHTGNPQSKAVS